jgi:type II secretory pathway pseudopilin PulG
MMRHKEFTLIELPVVITMIAVLMVILIAVLQSVREHGKRFIFKQLQTTQVRLDPVCVC